MSPASGLNDGSVVTVSGTSFPPNDPLVVIECSPLAATAANAQAECDLKTAQLSVKSDDSGQFSTALTVHTGGIASDPSAVCPPATGYCVIAVSELSTSSSVHAQVDIAFTGQPPAPDNGTSGGTTAGAENMTSTPADGASGASGGGAGGAVGSSLTSSAVGGVALAATSRPMTLAATGNGRWLIAVALGGAALVDLGYLALSATWPRRRRLRHPVR